MAKNYYIILGLKRDASDEAIRSAYRQLAKNYHPDHYGIDSGPFLQIQEAYEVLNNPERKRQYDDLLKTKRKSTEIFKDVTTESFSRKHVEPLSPERNQWPSAALPVRRFGTCMSSFDEIYDYRRLPYILRFIVKNIV